MGLIGAMADWADEGNRYPAANVTVGAMPLKISPVVSYIDYMAVWVSSCTEVTPIASNGRGRFWAAVSANTGQLVEGAGPHSCIRKWLYLKNKKIV